MQHLSDVSSLKQASLGWCTGLMSLDPDWCFLYSSKETFPPHFGNGWGVAFCQPCMIPGGTMGGFLTTKKDSWATENCLWLACLASDKLGWNQVSFKRCYTKVPLHLYNATKKKTSSRFFFFFVLHWENIVIWCVCPSETGEIDPPRERSLFMGRREGMGDGGGIIFLYDKMYSVLSECRFSLMSASFPTLRE